MWKYLNHTLRHGTGEFELDGCKVPGHTGMSAISMQCSAPSRGAISSALQSAQSDFQSHSGTYLEEMHMVEKWMISK